MLRGNMLRGTCCLKQHRSTATRNKQHVACCRQQNINYVAEIQATCCGQQATCCGQQLSNLLPATCCLLPATCCSSMQLVAAQHVALV